MTEQVVNVNDMFWMNINLQYFFENTKIHVRYTALDVNFSRRGKTGFRLA